MWVLLYNGKETISSALNSRMRAEQNTVPLTATVHWNEAQLRKLLRSYLMVVSYLLKKYTTDAATA